MSIIRARARLFVQARNRLEVVVHHVGRSFGEDIERALEAPPKIGDQHLDPGLGRALANRTDAIDEMTGTAVAQVVAVDAGDHDV